MWIIRWRGVFTYIQYVFNNVNRISEDFKETLCSSLSTVKTDKKLSVARCGGGRGRLADVLGPDCDVIGEQIGMLFQTGGKCGQGWNQVVCVLC